MWLALLSKLWKPLLGVSILAGVWFHGYQTGTQKAYQKAIQEIAKMDKKCPDCKCPEQKPCNGLDYDKIKGRNITIENHQHITTSIGDSLLIQKLDALFTQRLNELKVVRAKR